LIATRVGGWTSEDHYPRGLATLPNGPLQPRDIDLEAFRQDYEALLASHAATGADVPWAAFPLFPLPWLEAIAGCPIQHRDGAIWAGHPWDSYERLAEGFELRPGNPWLDRLLQFTAWLVRLADGRFPVALSLMRGPADLLSALRGPQQMVFDLYDQPERVDLALERLTWFWTQVAEAQLAMIPPFHGGHAFSVINLWARQPGGWFQDDAIALWSPPFYRRHLRSHEECLSRSMAVTGIHLHSGTLFSLDALLEMPDLDVIEINVDLNGPSVADLIPHFRRALERKCLVVWGEFSAADYGLMAHHLPARGLALQVMAPTPELAVASIRELKRAWGAA
jgi:hypothetical protein